MNITESPISKKNSSIFLIAWVIFLGVGLVGMYVVMLIPAYTGKPPELMYFSYSIIWNALFLTFLWKALNRKKLIGFILGAFFGVATFTAVVYIAMHSSPKISNNTKTVMIDYHLNNKLSIL